MLLTVRNLSSILKVPEATVYRWIREAGLPAREISGHYRAHPVDLLEWIADHPVPVHPRSLPTDETEGPVPSLEAAIRAGGVFHDLPGTTRGDVLAALTIRIPPIAGLPVEDLGRLLARRESVGSAYLADGIAVPNPRYPLVHTAAPPMMIIAFPRDVVVWNGEGTTVGTIFTLITPTVRSHLRLLGRIIFALHDRTFRNLMTRRAGEPEFLALANDLDHAAGVGLTCAPERAHP